MYGFSLLRFEDASYQSHQRPAPACEAKMWDEIPGETVIALNPVFYTLYASGAKLRGPNRARDVINSML